METVSVPVYDDTSLCVPGPPPGRPTAPKPGGPTNADPVLHSLNLNEFDLDPSEAAVLDPRVKELREAMARFSGGGAGGGAVRDPRARPAPVATAPSAASQAAPRASAAASAPSVAASRPDGPTLMDFLPFMKPKTFGDYSTGE